MPEVSSATSVHDARVALVRLVRRYGALLDPAIAPLVSRAVSMDLSDVGGGTLGATESVHNEDALSTPREKHQEHQQQQEEHMVVLMPADDPEANDMVRVHETGEEGFQRGAAASGDEDEDGRALGAGDAEPSSPRPWLKQDSETSMASSQVVGRCTAPVSDAACAASSNDRPLQLARGEPGEADGRKEGDSARDNERSSGDGPPAAGGATAAAAASPEPTHRSVLALYELIGACLRASAATGDGASEGSNVAAGSRASTEGQKEAPGLQVLASETAAYGTTEQQQSASGGESIANGAEGSPGGSGGAGDGARGKSGRFSFFSGRLMGSSKGAGVSGSGGACGGSSSGKGAGSAGAAAAGGTIIGPVRTPLVRWYDARARVALRRLCHWLHIPGPKMHAMEQMWALQLLRLRPDGQFDVTAGAGPAGTTGNGPRYRAYLKISAGALGGAALLALTGGLAAPAIAAGLGSAIMVFGGSTAAAAAVTTLGGTAAGTAAITGTFGVIGASHAGSKTAALYGEVREFGFWSISAPFILPPPPSAVESPEARGGDSGDGNDTTGINDPSDPCSTVGGSMSRWSSLFRWGPKGGNKTDSPGALNKSRSLPQQPEQGNETAKQVDGLRVAQPVPPPSLPPLPLPPRREVSEPGNVMQSRPGCAAHAAVPLPRAGTSSNAAALLTATAVAPSPALTRQSRSSSTVSRDGLFIPADLLVEDGVHGNSGGSGAGEGMASDLSHPAALFRHVPVTPYPPPPADDDPDALALTLTAVAVPAGAPAAAADRRSRATLASASSTESSALAPAAGNRGASDGGAFGNIGAIRQISTHPLHTRSNRSDGGGAPAVNRSIAGATNSFRSRSRTTSLGGAAVPKRDGANIVSMVEGGKEKSYNHIEGMLCSRADGASEQAGDGDGGDAELAASDRSAARARLETAGPDGAFVKALLAELDAEAADLDGNSNGCTEPATAVAVAATDATSDSGPSSRWSWFRSSNKQPRTTAGGEISGGCGTTATAVEDRKWTKWTGKGEQARPLLRVPVDPKRIGESTLALTIAVNGWVKQPEDFVSPWRQLPSSGRELWALVWESDVLQSLDGALRRFIRDKAIEESSKMVLRLGVSTALVTAMMLPMAVMSAINFTIGSCWRLALRRAQLGGRCLAHMLMQGGHGDRPVTLVSTAPARRLHAMRSVNRKHKSKPCLST
ncbi:hypothetical protein Vafri_8358 [Volvox africanus]|nr:hypothetical protein Vafri_8358 [Volvox africanus]